MRWIALLLLVFMMVGCEKTIDFNLQQNNAAVVIDGTIENGQPPVVILSSTFNYFSNISSDLLSKSFLHGAVIKVGNGFQTQTLREYAVVQPGSKDSLYYYSSDPLQGANAFKGDFGRTYQLSVSVGGKEYMATTTIPVLAKKVDSIWWKPAPNNPDPSLVVLVGKTTDPKGFGNYIRYFTSVNGGPFLPGLNSVFDDQIIDGTTYTVEIEKGVDRNVKIDVENYSFFHRGDTAVLKFCNIDKTTYDFWRTMEFSYASIGNPFSSPTKVSGNISNGALGYFGGYAAMYDTLRIPR
jgi:Domain of unknown function (DUF4249)